MVAILFGGMMEVFGVPLWLAVPIAISIGVLGGLVNGLLAARTGINGFIVTLATASAFTGVNLGLTKSVPFYKMPTALQDFGNGRIGAFPFLLIAPLVVSPLLALFLFRLPIGRRLLAVGGNSQAAALSGISPANAIVLAHCLSGLLAAIGAVLAVAQLGSAQPLIGSDWLLLSFAAPIIGGTALAGGYVSIIGAILAVLVIALIQNGLVLANVNPVLGAVPARRADRRDDRPQSLARAPNPIGVVAAVDLSIDHVSKNFPGVRALDDITFHVSPGEIHALMGENGAGKSTLIKIVTGVYKPDSGRLLLDGRSVEFASPRDALAAAIGAVHQERNLIPRFSVGENILLEHLPTRSGMVDYAEVHRQARACPRPPRSHHRYAGRGGDALGRADADRRNRQGALARGQAPAARRADRLDHRPRGGRAVRRAAPAQGAGRRDRLRQPQARGSALALRPCDGAA